MNIELQESVSDSDLTAIKKIAPLIEQGDIFTAEVKIIDDKNTANLNQYTTEWQQSVVSDFVGVPVLVNHDNNQSLVLGRVFAAEQRDNAIFGKIYIPTNTEVGREAVNKIKAGLFKSVSLNVTATNTEKQGEITRILPGDDDRVYEISFVAVPGCKSCEVQTGCQESRNSPCGCESAPKTEAKPEEWNQYAKQLREDAINAVMKAGAFVFGDDFSESTYQSIAEKLSPDELTVMGRNLTETYERMQESTPTPEAKEYKPLNDVLRNNRRT